MVLESFGYTKLQEEYKTVLADMQNKTAEAANRTKRFAASFSVIFTAVSNIAKIYKFAAAEYRYQKIQKELNNLR